jgi:hypothetical protein
MTMKRRLVLRSARRKSLERLLTGCLHGSTLAIRLLAASRRAVPAVRTGRREPLAAHRALAVRAEIPTNLSPLRKQRVPAALDTVAPPPATTEPHIGASTPKAAPGRMGVDDVGRLKLNVRHGATDRQSLDITNPAIRHGAAGRLRNPRLHMTKHLAPRRRVQPVRDLLVAARTDPATDALVPLPVVPQVKALQSHTKRCPTHYPLPDQ